MNRIDSWRLKALLHNGTYRKVYVAASFGGGWFLQRGKQA